MNGSSVELRRPETVWWNTRPGLTLNRTQLDRRAAMQSTQDIASRLLAGSGRDPDTGCLRWTGVHNAKGYGFISAWGKSRAVHRGSHARKDRAMTTDREPEFLTTMDDIREQWMDAMTFPDRETRGRIWDEAIRAHDAEVIARKVGCCEHVRCPGGSLCCCLTEKHDALYAIIEQAMHESWGDATEYALAPGRVTDAVLAWMDDEGYATRIRRGEGE